MFELLEIATILFLVIVAPIWITFHYITRLKRDRQGVAANLPPEQLSDLSQRAQTMSQRIDALESILDAEVPGWRTRQ